MQRGGAVNKEDGRPLKGVCEGGSRVGGNLIWVEGKGGRRSGGMQEGCN